MKAIDYRHFSTARLSMIRSLECGEIDKEGFIRRNALLYKDLDVAIITDMTDFEMGLFYYHYYNTMAKFHQMEYRELRRDEPAIAARHRLRSEEFYSYKEGVTYQLLEMAQDEPIEAYYISCHSARLNRNLVEIVFKGREKVILHSVDHAVIALLADRQWLRAGVSLSLIDTYINKRYYSTK